MVKRFFKKYLTTTHYYFRQHIFRFAFVKIAFYTEGGVIVINILQYNQKFNIYFFFFSFRHTKLHHILIDPTFIIVLTKQNHYT